jgi:hypothetical protein
MNIRCRVVLAALFLVVLWPLRGFAQGGSASLSGRVVDRSNLPVVGTRIRAINSETNIVYPGETNDAGLYNLPSLPPGTYQIQVDKDGFEKLVRPDVVLHVADNISIDFTLQVGSVSQTVTVQGGAPLVDTTTSSLGGLVEEHEVEGLPLNGRNYVNLTLLQPGISPDTNMASNVYISGTWYSSNGAPLRSNNFTLDGAILQDINAGSTATLSGTTLGLDGIQEYRVITNTVPAEYGMTMGSQTVIVSKSGTNAFHGSAFEYLRNSALDARNYFDTPADSGGHRLPEFQRNNFGGSLGGPIRKNKTFFFLTYEGLREAMGISTITDTLGAGCHGAAGATITNTACPQLGSTASVTIVPVIAPILALFPLPNLSGNVLTFPYSQPNRDDYGQIRVDEAISATDTLFGRYTIDDDAQVFGLPFPQFTGPRLSRHQYGTVSENHVHSSSLLNSFGISYSRTATHRLSPSDIIGPEYSFVSGQDIGDISIGGVSSFGPLGATPNIQIQNIYSLKDDVFYTTGRHSLKFGALINGFRDFGLNSGTVPGSLSFSGIATFLAGEPSVEKAVTPGSILARYYSYYTLGFYAQDDWRLRPNFTLNAGLRYEPTTQMEEAHGLQSSLRNPAVDSAYTLGPVFQNPSLHNFSPRLGFAWDVRGDGKTVVRAGAALLYDVNNFMTGVLSSSPGEPPFSSTSTISNAPSFTLPLVFPPSAVGTSGDLTFQYHLQQPRLYTENLTVERQLPFSMALAVSYAGSRGIHLITDSEGNPNVAVADPAAPGGIIFPTPTVHVNPHWGNVTYYNSSGDSVYNALEVSLIKRVTKGLQFQSSYTWGKIIDNTQGLGAGENLASSTFRTDPYSTRFDRGLASFDIPQNWVVNAIYTLPSPVTEERVLRTLASGWAMSGIFTVHSGLPFNPTDAAERSRSGVNGGSNSGGSNIDRPDWNASFSGPVILGIPNEYFNPNAFMLQPAGTLGNVGRNSLLGPGFEDLDFSLRKNTKLSFLGEAGNMEFRADFFNILNRANFSEPNNTVFAGTLTDLTETPLSTAGEITSTVAPSRQIQVSLRLSW